MKKKYLCGFFIILFIILILSSIYILNFKFENNMILKNRMKYDQNFSINENEKAAFDDFTLVFLGSKTVSMGIFGGSERYKTNYIFKISYKENNSEKTKEVIWSYGYPGGIGGTAFKAGRRKTFIINSDISQLGKIWNISRLNEIQYGENVNFLKNKILEYPDFDITLKNAVFENKKYTDKQKMEYLSETEKIFKNQKIPFTDVIKRSYLENIDSFSVSKFSFEIVHNGKTQIFTYTIINGVLKNYTEGGNFIIADKQYQIENTQQLGGTGSTDIGMIGKITEINKKH